MQGNVFLGLGSNLGDRVSFLENAIAQLESEEEINVLKRSSMIQTEPIGNLEQPKFINMVVEVETSLTPKALLDVCLEIESDNGRVRDGKCKWGARTLDIDVLFYGSAVVCSPGLQIPHPEAAHRHFVLEPLAEIAPMFEHPITEEPILAMLQLL